MSLGESPSVSVVVPVFNAAATLHELTSRLLPVLLERYTRHEILLVDDGSRDRSWALIEELAAQHRPVMGVRLARNCGQTAAWCAGIEAASGDVIVTIDADLDTLPEDLPLLVQAIQDGAEAANGARQGRHWRRRVPSRAFNLRTRALGFGYTDTGCGMTAMRADLAREVLEHGELRRSFRFKVLLASLTNRLVEVPVRSGSHSPSDHRLADLFSAGLEVDVAFRRTVFLGIAAAAAGLAALGGIAAVVAALFALGTASAGWIAAVAVVIALAASSLTVTAVAANLVLRSVHHLSTPFYRVAETIDRQDRW